MPPHQLKIFGFTLIFTLFAANVMKEQPCEAGKRGLWGAKKSPGYQAPKNTHQAVRRLGDIRRQQSTVFFFKSKRKEIEKTLLEKIIKESKTHVVSEVHMWEVLNFHSMIEKEFAVAEAKGEIVEAPLKMQLRSLFDLRIGMDQVRRKANFLSHNIREFLIEPNKAIDSLQGLKRELASTTSELEKNLTIANEITSPHFNLAIEKLYDVKRSLEHLLHELELDLELAEDELSKDDHFFNVIANQQLWYY